MKIYSLHKMMFLFSVRMIVCNSMKNWHSEYLLQPNCVWWHKNVISSIKMCIFVHVWIQLMYPWKHTPEQKLV